MKLYLKLNETNIVGHKYESDAEHLTEIDNPPENENGYPSLIDENGDYKYKYLEGELVELTEQEINEHPNKIKKQNNLTLEGYKELALKLVVLNELKNKGKLTQEMKDLVNDEIDEIELLLA